MLMTDLMARVLLDFRTQLTKQNVNLNVNNT